MEKSYAKLRLGPSWLGQAETGIYYLVTVAETVFVISAEAGIQLFRSGPLLLASAGTSLHLRKQVQG